MICLITIEEYFSESSSQDEDQGASDSTVSGDETGRVDQLQAIVRRGATARRRVVESHCLRAKA